MYINEKKKIYIHIYHIIYKTHRLHGTVDTPIPVIDTMNVAMAQAE